ncbi:MAG: circularly permuted type 2 ATP-grasp protein [Chloroflexi bacterium]|nr:circularly permuted type 2 ATP-grasp protein [Chloroflexota bacterium]
MADGLFRDYESSGFCEVFGDASPRAHYARLLDRLEALGPTEMTARADMVGSILRRQGITFNVYGHQAGTERTWPLDLVPRLIPADEWSHLERGLAQRVRVLDMFLDDLYVGERTAIRDGVIPGWLVESSPGYVREAIGIHVRGARCVVSGIDLVRDIEGTYRVLEDNLRVPSGVAYVLENRAAMTRALSSAFEPYRVRPVHHYGASLLRTLRELAPSHAHDPTVVVLTPGVFNSAYFEHVFLARQMGVELVEGRDLVVEDGRVHMRTTRGLQRVDVIYRRVNDDSVDPVVFRPESLLGVPGLMSVIRSGGVSVANAIGNGVIDDKALYPYVPALIRHYLGEEPIIPNVTTYLPWEPDQLEAILGRLDQLVVKPATESGGYGIVIGPAASAEELDQVAANLQADPRSFIAQEVIALSTHPTWTDQGLRARHIDLRPFVLQGETVEVIPGGLTRVALREGSLIVNSSQGGGSKDTWVLA